jgi:thiaminase/transcriptional activator TenA
MYNTAAPKLTQAQRANAKDLFIKSARYEYQFWDMAFRQEPWLP